MLPNALTDRVQLQEKTTVQTATGQTEIWKPAGYYYARVIPLDVKTVAYYQQLSTVVTHEVILRGTVSISIGGHRVIHGAKTYEPTASAKHLDGMTDVVVVEV
jgi:head-tail adaptor